MSDTHTRRRSVVVPVVIAVVAALVAVFLLIGERSDSSGRGSHSDTGQSATSAPERNDSVQRALDRLIRRTPGDPLAQGKVDAPVVMIDFSDFQCPFCGQFARTTGQKLREKYVKTGVLRIEWRDFPYFGKESNRAALVARAAGDQGGFWKFHDALFAHQSPPNSGDLTLDHLVKVAESVGLDGPQLRADLKNHRARYKAAVDKDFRQGQSIGISGTPAFLINGRPVMGVQPLSVFEKAIEQAAAEAKNTDG